ncbi:MAG: ABC transporter permease subunit [Butyrivibrio sp.]|nr:ABC transporter permease subunit [Butyrivibrio sp.]
MKSKRTLFTIISAALWLVIWLILARLANREIFFPSPGAVLSSLGALARSKEFYSRIFVSLSGIAAGFLAGVAAGIPLSVLAFRFPFFEAFIGVPIKIIKAVPVASFVILALLWLDSDKLSILISAMMVMPVIYTNTLSGLRSADPKMLEFAKVFRLSAGKRVRYIYIPAIISPLISASSVAIGFAWKSGIAAEIIGLIRGSIGNELYKAKLYLETPKLFAWTVTVVLISVLCEKIIVLLLSLAGKALGGVNDDGHTN